MKKCSNRHHLITVSLLSAFLLMLTWSSAVFAADPIRIVVLPFYNEEGVDTKEGGAATNHYRRMMRFINNQLVHHDFEVINPFAHDSSEREYNRVMERAREDSPLAGLEMCKKYGTDAAYIVWLKVKVRKTDDGYCKASARMDGEGYDSAGHDLGAGLSKTFKITRRDCDDAIAEVEKEVGDLVGRKLTAWSGESRSASTVVVPAATTTGAAATVVPETPPAAQGGVLERNIRNKQNLITVRLDHATDYAVAEVFGKVVNTARGVTQAKMYSSRIVPDNPQACFANWRVTIDTNETEPFRLQANILKMLGDISDAGGEITVNGVPYRYTPAEIDMLRGIRPGDATSREIQFIADRELARDKQMAGQNDPYQAKKQQGFD